MLMQSYTHLQVGMNLLARELSQGPWWMCPRPTHLKTLDPKAATKKTKATTPAKPSRREWLEVGGLQMKGGCQLEP